MGGFVDSPKEPEIEPLPSPKPTAAELETPEESVAGAREADRKHRAAVAAANRNERDEDIQTDPLGLPSRAQGRSRLLQNRNPQAWLGQVYQNFLRAI